MTLRANRFDAIVVGSGISGGIAALELTKLGLRTVLLERGEITTQRNNKSGAINAPIQRSCYAWNEETKHLFVDDHDHFYENSNSGPFQWIRGYHLGGRSLTWAGQCYRLTDLDMRANEVDGFGAGWPLDYKELSPWYDRIERFIGVAGNRESTPMLPGGCFRGAFVGNSAEQFFANRVSKFKRKIAITSSRVAILATKEGGRNAWNTNLSMVQNAFHGAVYNSTTLPIPLALATKRLVIRTGGVVERIIEGKTPTSGAGVVVKFQNGGTQEYYGSVIFLCASTLASTKILLNSRSRNFPDGIGASSGVLGRFLMDHTFKMGADGILETPRAAEFPNLPFGLYIPRFCNTGDRETQSTKYCRGFALRVNAWPLDLEPKEHVRPPENLSKSAKGFKCWRIRLSGWGEALPQPENHIQVITNSALYGENLKIHYEWTDNEKVMNQEATNACADILESIGAKSISVFNHKALPGQCIHEMGTARMGNDWRTSVLNKYNQVHEMQNVFVTDGAAFPSSATQNPSLTYMALTSRACHHAVSELRSGNI